MKKYLVTLLLIVPLLTLPACNGADEPPPAQPVEEPEAEETTEDTTSELPPAEPELAGPEVGTTMEWVDGSLLVYVPAGEFIMGNESEDSPEHVVFQEEYWIYRTQVTNRMYANCVAVGVCPPIEDEEFAADLDKPTEGNKPVAGVTWEQASAYCTWVHGSLPTEAQWEKAARGPQGNPYPWGEASPDCDLLNFNNCVGKTTNVTHYLEGKSFFEAFDMGGNTFEWVADWYDPAYYTSAPPENPTGPETGENRSVRGSSYESDPEEIAAASRSSQAPEATGGDLGFRCVVINPIPFPPYCETPSYLPGDFETGEPDSSGCEPDFSYVGSFCEGGEGFATLDTGQEIPNTGEFSVTSEEEGLECGPSPSGTTRLLCQGFPAGYEVTARVCGPCGGGGETTALPFISGNSELTQEMCFSGYSYNPETGECEYEPESGDPYEGEECDSEGFTFVTDYGCLPDPDPEGDCPQGSYFDTLSETCVPSDGSPDCFYGFTEYPGEETCNDQCLEGYYFDTARGCCTREGGGGEPSGEPGCQPGYTELYGTEICGTGPYQLTGGGIGCLNLTFYVDSCTGMSEGGSCTACSCYSDSTSCSNAGCIWDTFNKICT